MKLRISLFLVLTFLLCNGKFSIAQTFNCFIANDHLVSATQYELDIYIQSTSTDFNFRTIQNCIIFNPAFIDSSANVTASFVIGSNQLTNYQPGPSTWSPAGYGFETTTNTGVTCATGTVISTTPVRVGTFRLVSNIPFNCVAANPSMVKLGDPTPSGLFLKMAVTAWNTINCSNGGNSTITSSGTFSQYGANTAYTQVINMRPVITAQPDSVTTCSTGLAHFSVSATGNSVISTPVTYQWYENGVAVVNGTAGSVTYSGATTSTLTVTTPPGPMNGHHFYCVVSQCNSDTTISALLTVTDANDNNACTIDNCSSVTGQITHIPVNVDDGNACTADACDPLTGTITHTVINTNDNDVCTTDGCNTLTGVYHIMANIDDGDPCTSDACDSLTGVVSHNTINTNDNNACTVDGCDPVTGVYHNPIAVTDNNPCTNDVCDPATGTITHPLFNTNDNNACTTDGCDPINGVFHTPVNIDDSIACTIDACDTATGNITHVNMNLPPPVITVANNCGSSLLTAASFIGSLLWSNGLSSTSITVSSPGPYSLTQTVNGCTSSPANAVAAPLIQPSVNLGNDTVVSSGFTYTLNAGTGFNSYLWSTNETTQTIVINSSGTYWVTVTDSDNCSNSDTIIVTLVNGISDLSGENDMIIYPNPVKNILYVSFMNKESIKSINIYNVLSQKQPAEYFPNKITGMFEINTSSVSAGIYFLEIITGKSKIISRFIKE